MGDLPLTPLPSPTYGIDFYNKYLASGGTKMLDPLTLSAIISGGSSLLSGLLGGLGKAHAAKKLVNATKPTTPYYETFSTLPYLQGLYQSSLLGALQQELPQSAKWGIDFNYLLSMLNKNNPLSPTAPRYYSPYNLLIQKYLK
jgi:hypothetical protein